VPSLALPGKGIGKEVLAATNRYANIRKMVAVFSAWFVSCQILETMNPSKHLRVVRGDKKGYKYGDLAFQVGGVSDETVKYGRRVLRDFDLRVTALARSRSNCTVNYRPVLSSERKLQNNKHATV
jgi:hypothetical protein